VLEQGVMPPHLRAFSSTFDCSLLVALAGTAAEDAAQPKGEARPIPSSILPSYRETQLGVANHNGAVVVGEERPALGSGIYSSVVSPFA
jgi:hypothetical protein